MCFLATNAVLSSLWNLTSHIRIAPQLNLRVLFWLFFFYPYPCFWDPTQPKLLYLNWLAFTSIAGWSHMCFSGLYWLLSFYEKRMCECMTWEIWYWPLLGSAGCWLLLHIMFTLTSHLQKWLSIERLLKEPNVVLQWECSKWVFHTFSRAAQGCCLTYKWLNIGHI